MRKDLNMKNLKKVDPARIKVKNCITVIKKKKKEKEN
jgi:hypothetical protein